VDGLYVAVATLTTSSILDPELTITDPWLKVFTAGYVLVGIGILVEVARWLGMGFIAARAEVEKSKAAASRRRRAAPEQGTRLDRFVPLVSMLHDGYAVYRLTGRLTPCAN
jgi:hypothetical protein